MIVVVDSICTDYKQEYMQRIFGKISHKQTESYVISRIWHRLNDLRVEFVIQQYVQLPNGKYALADLYLPQLGIFIEINEPFHENKKEADQIRNRRIEKITGCKVYVIDCNTTLDEIHRQIEEIVEIIKRAILAKGSAFVPWMGDAIFSVAYHRRKGWLRVADNDCLRTIDDVFDLFGATAKRRGFLRDACAPVPNKPDEIIWCADSNSRNWHNELSYDGEIMREYNKDPLKRGAHVQHHKNNSTNVKRITFLKEKNYLGFVLYRFIGVFKLHPEQSKNDNMCVWCRISNEYQLP